MTLSHHPGFTLVGDVITREVLPRLRYAQKLPLRLSCMGTAGYEGLDEADEFDRTVVIGQSASAEEAMILARQRDTLRFHPRIVVIQDGDLGLVLGGEIRAGIVLWQQPVVSDVEARRIITEASRLRGLAFAASGRVDHSAARDHRYRASLLEARLVDPYWRETAAELLHLPQAA
jgi:hypothetical protein